MATRVVTIPLDAEMHGSRFAFTSGTVFAVLSTDGPVYVSLEGGGSDDNAIDLQARGDKIISCRPVKELFATVLAGDVVANGECRLLVSDELDLAFGSG